MAKSFIFTIHRFGALNDGKRVVNVAKNLKDALANVKALYGGYHIEVVEA